MKQKEQYSVNQVSIFNIKDLMSICRTLYLAGKDMSARYNLNHWNNSYFKEWIIVILCVLKNRLYLVNLDKLPVATFQLKKIGSAMRFEKLATNPQYMNKGIGRYCLEAMEQIAKSEGCTNLLCEVYGKSEHAKAFYKNNGFTVFGETKTLKYTEVKMKKEI